MLTLSVISFLPFERGSRRIRKMAISVENELITAAKNKITSLADKIDFILFVFY